MPRSLTRLRWPQGRYNGLKISGIRIEAKLDLLWWHWRPLVRLAFGTLTLHWLFVHAWIEAQYHHEFKARECPIPRIPEGRSWWRL